MKDNLRRSLGFILVTAAALGLMLALVGLVGIWSYKNRVIHLLDEQIGLAVSVLDTTSQGLSVAGAALQTTQSTVQTLDETIQVLAKSITDTLPVLDSLSNILGTELPQTIVATQTSLKAAQASAKIIDDALKILTAIPFLPTKPYNPQVPLNVALADVSSSLDGMPASFRSMEGDLQKTNANLSLVQKNVDQVKDEVAKVHTSLEQANTIITQYQESASTLKSRLEQFRRQIPKAVNSTATILTLFFIWLAVAQVGLWTQGLELIKKE